jgi:hypothetical protein
VSLTRGRNIWLKDGYAGITILMKIPLFFYKLIEQYMPHFDFYDYKILNFDIVINIGNL